MHIVSRSQDPLDFKPAFEVMYVPGADREENDSLDNSPPFDPGVLDSSAICPYNTCNQVGRNEKLTVDSAAGCQVSTCCVPINWTEERTVPMYSLPYYQVRLFILDEL